MCILSRKPSSALCMLTNGCNNVMQDHVGVLARRMFAYAYETFVTDEDYNPWGVQ